MVAVGLWARLLGGPALIALPAAFMAAMLAGGVMAMAGWTLPAVEAGIPVSVLVLWALIVFRARPPILIGSGVCAVFAVAHGYAHGAEMATGSNPAQYAAGFLFATAVLLLMGSGLPHLVGGVKREA
jgi:urease accessory protein